MFAVRRLVDSADSFTTMRRVNLTGMAWNSPDECRSGCRLVRNSFFEGSVMSCRDIASVLSFVVILLASVLPGDSLAQNRAASEEGPQTTTQKAESSANSKIAVTSQSEKSSSEFLEIPPERASKYLGQRIKMKFTVQAIGRGGEGGSLIELNSTPAWNAPENVHVLITPAVAAAFVQDGIKNPEQFFRFREIAVTGILQDRRPGGFLVPALELASTSDLQYTLESARVSLPVSQLQNQRVDLFLNKGKSYANVLITEVEVGGDSESFLSLQVTMIDGTQPKHRASAIAELTVDGVPLDLKYNKETKECAADLVKREARIREGKVDELRLASLGYQIHRRRTDADHQQSLKANHEFIESVKAFFPELPIRTMERDFFLIVTDIPPAQGDVHFQYLDRLYEDMCNSFGIPIGTNLWQGKCIVCAFQDREKFVRFEVEFMKNSRESASISGGFCHGDDDRIVISLFKGDLAESRFAYVLVHETSHGIVNRFLSDAQIPSWLNEGMALWIGAAIVKEDKDTLHSSLEESIATLRQQKSLDRMFDVPQIHGKYYGASAAVVDLLLNKKKGAFRQYFIDLKHGYSQEEALQRSFGLTLQRLAIEYGRSIGVPKLTP